MLNLTSAVLCKSTSTTAQCIFYHVGGIVHVESLNSTKNALLIQSAVASGASFSQIANITSKLDSVGFFDGSPSLRSSNIVGCTSAADTNGLVWIASFATPEFTNCVILGNTVPGSRLFRVDSQSTLTVSGCSLQSFTFLGAVTTVSMRVMAELLLFLYVHEECEGRAGSVRSPGPAAFNRGLRRIGCAPVLILLFLS
jgi:hypothetical protein